MTRKEQINFLFINYKRGAYTTETFCDEFIRVLYYEEDASINKEEYNVLDFYANIFSRFSPYEEDVRSGFLFGEEKVQEAFNDLIKKWFEEATQGDARALGEESQDKG